MGNKHKYINSENIIELFPKWLVDPYFLVSMLDDYLEKIFLETPEYKYEDPYETLKFNIFAKDGKMSVYDELSNSRMGCFIVDNIDGERGDRKFQLSIPLNAMLRGHESVVDKHIVYTHGIVDDDGNQMAYVGLTKQKWHSRFNQHMSNANSGSPYVFHQAIRKYSHNPMVHRVEFVALDYEDAMNMEEKLVSATLYPNGLNMIPGGFAGLKYLHKLGYKIGSIKQRDAAILTLSKRENIDGNPNPLCAARWQSDQSFVNKVICGHGNRLTVDQVTSIRRYSDFGFDNEKIVESLSLKNISQAENVLSNKRYSRVK